MILPWHLRQAIETELQDVSLRSVTRTARDLRERYRSRETQGGAPVRSDADVRAYAVSRFPSTYAAVYAALDAVKALRPGWHPRSVLDVAAGPGTATFAALALWPEIERATLLDKEPGMLDMAQRLARSVPARALQSAKFVRFDATSAWQIEPHDLVISAYLLSELPESKHDALVRRMWASAANALCLIEPAKSSPGFEIVRRARRLLIDDGAFIVAPCPHAHACPMPPNRWCHFAQRVERTRVHRVVKEGFRPYEDEKFSYVAAAREMGFPFEARVTLQPQQTQAGMELELCTQAGVLVRTLVQKRDRAAYRLARKLRWGSAIVAGDADEPVGE